MVSERQKFNTVLMGEEKRQTMVPILMGELGKSGVTKFLKDTLEMRNAAATSARHPGVWKESIVEFDPEALTLTRYLRRTSLQRTSANGPFATEAVALEFSIPEENQSRTIKITGAEQTYEGEIPDMTDVSDNKRETRQRFMKAIADAMDKPQVVDDLGNMPPDWSSPAVPKFRF